MSGRRRVERWGGVEGKRDGREAERGVEERGRDGEESREMRVVEERERGMEKGVPSTGRLALRKVEIYE